LAKIIAPQFKEAEYIRRVWCASPEKGVTVEDMLVPSFWAHVAKQLRPGDRIEAVGNDGSWFVELFVRSASGNDARVAVLRAVKLDQEVPAVESDDYEIKYRGNAKWSVVRKSDKAVLIDGQDTKEQAAEWLAKHLGQGA
jgi:hypothetical protein